MCLPSRGDVSEPIVSVPIATEPPFPRRHGGSSRRVGRQQSFVAGLPKNGMQFMIKEWQRFAATGGWGYTQFNDGKSADEAMHNTCAPCHESAKARD